MKLCVGELCFLLLSDRLTASSFLGRHASGFRLATIGQRMTALAWPILALKPASTRQRTGLWKTSLRKPGC